MDGLVCDVCGTPLLLDADVRYVVDIEGYAAWDPLEITREELAADHRAEIDRLIDTLEEIDAEAAQDEVHRRFRYDLCPRCWRRFLADPLAALRKEPPSSGGARDQNEKSQGD